MPHSTVRHRVGKVFSGICIQQRHNAHFLNLGCTSEKETMSSEREWLTITTVCSSYYGNRHVSGGSTLYSANFVERVLDNVILLQ